jgi:hypothetical protein
VKREVRAQARSLRMQGMSVRDITKTLNVSKSSVSSWVRDIELTNDQIETLKLNQRRYEQQNKGAQSNQIMHRARRIEYQLEGRMKAREGRSLHLAGCLLYWAEGAKDKNAVYFVNSDANMVRLFVRFLREEMLVADVDFSLYIHCHYPEADELRRVEIYWLTVLGLEASCLRKTQIKKGSNTRKNILVNGVCGIRVNKSTRLIQHIYGAIQEYAGFDNPAWLF